jgi:hypothetical protein
MSIAKAQSSGPVRIRYFCHPRPRAILLMDWILGNGNILAWHFGLQKECPAIRMRFDAKTVLRNFDKFLQMKRSK